MLKIFRKTFLWFISLTLIYNNYIDFSLADESIITRPKSAFIPDENFFDQEGNKVSLDQFEGKTILVSFWASWCGSCIEELPSLDILQKDFRKLPFEVVAISEDFKGIEAAKDHFEKYEIRHLKLYHDYKNALFKSMEVIGLPTTFLIDPNGKIKVIFKGNIKWHDDSIRNILLSEVAGNPETPKNSYTQTSLNKKIGKTTKPIKEKSSPEIKDKEKNDNKNSVTDNKLEQPNENNKGK